MSAWVAWVPGPRLPTGPNIDTYLPGLHPLGENMFEQQGELLLIQFFRCAGSKVPTPPPNDEAAAPISVTEMVSSTPTISVTPAKPSSRFNVVDLEIGVGNSAEEEAPVAPPPATNRFTVRIFVRYGLHLMQIPAHKYWAPANGSYVVW